jgi:hypothetical protein
MFTHPYVTSKIISSRRLDVPAAAGQRPPGRQIRTQGEARRRERVRRWLLRRALRAATTGHIEDPV